MEVALRGEELDLGDLCLGDQQLEALLLDTSYVPVDNITCWKLCGDRLTHIGATALGSTLRHGVKVLNLARNELGARGVDAMRGLALGHKLTQLRSLNLSANGLKSDAVAALCDALVECQLLLRLDLNCNEIREGSSLGRLVAEHSSLTRLAAHGNYLMANGGMALFRGVLENVENSGRLADIDLAWNGLGEGNAMDCAKALAAVLLRSNTLFHLDLSYNSLGAQCCAIVADAMRDNHHLFGLHMVGNAVVVDSNGFLTPLDANASGAEPARAMQFGDPRSGTCQLVGASKKSSVHRGPAKQWSDDNILRDRDPLEQQTTCWACEGWERVELRWVVQNGEELPGAVWAFTNIDHFRYGMRLNPSEDKLRFAGTRMVPPGKQLLVIFQVDSALRLEPDVQVEQLAEPVCIDLCYCREQPATGPSVARISEVGVASVERTPVPLVQSGLAGTRVVLLDGPDGPVQLPRVTESELRATTTKVRQKSILASFRRDTRKTLQKSFALDWSMIRKNRLVPEDEDASVGQLVESAYGHIVAIYRQISANGVSGTSGFGVSSLDAGNLAVETGLVDGQATKLSDIDRFFIASNVMSSEQKRDLIVRNDRELVRFQFLEFLLRIADQRFRQSGDARSMTDATSRMLQQLTSAGDARLQDMDRFFAAIYKDDVDDVYRKHLPALESVYQRFSGRQGQVGHGRFMSHLEFQGLLEGFGAYDGEFQQRQSGVAFRMGMMTRDDECYSTRFQEMSFLEYLHAIGAVVFLRSGFVDERMAALLDEFLSDKLPRCLRGAVPAGMGGDTPETHGNKASRRHLDDGSVRPCSSPFFSSSSAPLG